MTRLLSTPTNGDAPTANDDFDQSLRVAIARRLGESGFQDRDRFDAFGWEKDPDEEEYAALYLRNPFAAGIIDKPAQLAWRNPPTVTDSDDDTEDTEFAEAVQKLARNHNAWTYATRVHRIAGVGEFALLFVDFNDVGDDMSKLASEPDLSNPSLDDIRGFRVVPQFAVDEIDYGDFGSERWGEPEHYHVDWTEDLDDDTEDTTGGARIHHSRVVEVPSKPPTMGEFSSRPRMEPLLNPLYDITKAMGSAAEVAYRGADKGLHINFDPSEVDPNAVTGDSGLQNNISEWYHGLQPTLNTVGGEVTDLGGEIPDPSPVLDSELTAISAATGFSKQFIEGAAAGEIASSETNLREDLGEVAERQEQYVTPYIVRRMIQTLIDAGILPTPRDGDYRVTWPDLFQLSAEETATVEQKRSQTAKNLGIMGDPAKEYVESGSFPEESAPAMPAVDESNPAVANQFDTLSGNADDPFSDIPVIPDGLTKLTRPWLVRWAEWVAAGRPEVTPVRQRANDFNPALHPRDPDTGQFVERSFQVPDDAPDFGDMSAPETLQYLDDNGADVSSVLAPDSGVTIDGIPDDATSVSDIGGGDGGEESGDDTATDTDDGDGGGRAVPESDITSFQEDLEPGDRIQYDDGSESSPIEEIVEDDGTVAAIFDEGFITEGTFTTDPDGGRDLTPEGETIQEELGVNTVDLSGLDEDARQDLVDSLQTEFENDEDLREFFGVVGAVQTTPPSDLRGEEGSNAAAAFQGSTRTFYVNPETFNDLQSDGELRPGGVGLGPTDRQTMVQHELGHARHFSKDAKEYGAIEERNLTDTEKQLASEEVSSYAAYNPHEFVAEVHTGLRNGVDFGDDVLELYEELNGPEVSSDDN